MKNHNKYEKLQDLIGYRFKKIANLQDALVHTSMRGAKYELLEFLGDRVLGLCIADMLYEENNNDKIKEIASKHAKLVSTDCLAEISKLWFLDQYLIHKIETLSQKVFADSAEAIIGAIYVDGDYQTAFDVVKKWWGRFWGHNSAEPKTKLQEYAQSLGLDIPVYETLATSGSDHMPTYTMQVTIAKSDQEIYKGVGAGGSKHEASKVAAQDLLNKLNQI